MSDHTYVGGELELFAQAQHWKGYWISRLRPYIRGSVLEVGAGIGANTLLLCDGAQTRWVCLEPDPQLAAQLGKALSSDALKDRTGARRRSADALTRANPFRVAGHADQNGQTPSSPEVRIGTMASLGPTEKFDTVLYIDVLEHIEHDREELEQAAKHLASGGRLIVLSPAHGWLFSEFDQSIGHYRRYTISGLESLTPPGLRVAKSFYLDSVGLLASAANRLLLRQALPNARQIQCWDNLMVPCSQLLDPITAYRLGKSVVCVWELP